MPDARVGMESPGMPKHVYFQQLGCLRGQNRTCLTDLIFIFSYSIATQSLSCKRPAVSGPEQSSQSAAPSEPHPCGQHLSRRITQQRSAPKVRRRSRTADNRRAPQVPGLDSSTRHISPMVGPTDSHNSRKAVASRPSVSLPAVWGCVAGPSSIEGDDFPTVTAYLVDHAALGPRRS